MAPSARIAFRARECRVNRPAMSAVADATTIYQGSVKNRPRFIPRRAR
jgi:hypothetical protein